MGMESDPPKLGRSVIGHLSLLLLLRTTHDTVTWTLQWPNSRLMSMTVDHVLLCVTVLRVSVNHSTFSVGHSKCFFRSKHSFLWVTMPVSAGHHVCFYRSQHVFL